MRERGLLEVLALSDALCESKRPTAARSRHQCDILGKRQSGSKKATGLPSGRDAGGAHGRAQVRQVQFLAQRSVGGKSMIEIRARRRARRAPQANPLSALAQTTPSPLL